MQVFRILAATVLVILCAASCGENTEGEGKSIDNFDRQLMLEHWADDIIIPAFANYRSSTDELLTATDIFIGDKSAASLEALRASWRDTYHAWQMVAMYNIGPAEQMQLANTTNVYPTNVALIESNSQLESIDPELPSNRPAIGYPAIEYLIYGDADLSSAEVIDQLQDDKRANHLRALVQILADDAALVHDQWTTEYRDVFVQADGSSATASVNKMTNDYIYYFEKQLRANKVGIPTGWFSTEPLPQNVEGLHAGDISKTLLIAALDAFQSFFNGQYLNDTDKGEGFASYLNYLGNNNSLEVDINAQLNAARAIALTLDDSFERQIATDNTKMLQLYDELQKAVVLLKVDMMQALNIKVDYVDADGD